VSKDRVETLAEVFQHSMDETLKAAREIPAEKRMKQLQAGKGHPLWHIGHLAFAFDVVLNRLALGGDSVLPGEYSVKFAPDFVGGAPVTANAGDYPSWDEVVEQYEKAGKAAIANIRALDDSDLPGGPKGPVPDTMADFFAVLGGTIGHMAIHDSYHRGQMKLICALD
jgi:hypothetical protein